MEYFELIKKRYSVRKFTDEPVKKEAIDNILELASPSYLTIFARSGAFALVATAICLLIAYPLAYAVSRANPKRQKFYIMLQLLSGKIEFFEKAAINATMGGKK